jgi:mannose-6-phosphate isomerase-like protein (cupin superfamily)
MTFNEKIAKIYNLKDFTGGWFVGDFDPSLMHTMDAEVAIKRYKAGDSEPAHVHKVADELTVVVSGKIAINGKIFFENDIIRIPAGQSAAFQAVTDAVTCVVKSPSVKGDKYVV